MSAPAWMPLYVADYLADTGHLSMAEHGAYMLLIMHYWRNGRLPNDDQSLASICHAVAMADWLQVRDKVLALWQFDDGRWHHKRLDHEMAKTKNISKARSLAGKAGASARYGEPMANATQSQSPSPIKKETGSLRSPAKKATRIPADFQPDLDEAERLGLSRQAAEKEAAAFADYWRAKPVNATKLDWPATWRNWVRKATKGGTSNEQFRFEQGVVVRPAVISESPTRAAARIARRGG